MFRFVCFIFFAAIFLNTASAQQPGAVYLNKDLEKISIDKATYYRTQQKNGELYDVQIFYVNGAKYMELGCKSIDPLVKQGKFITYDASGKKMAEGGYADDKYDGRCVEYFSPSGKPKRVAKYERGMLNGSLTRFDSISGNVLVKCNFVDDKLDGIKTIFDRTTGNKREEAYYVEGILHGAYATFDSISGLKIESGYFDNGKREGEWATYFDDTNKVSDVIFYRSGYTNGYCAAFHFSGNTHFELLAKGGYPVGKAYFYHDKPGLVSAEINFEDGLPEGEMRRFDSATGKVIMTGSFVRGKRSGKWTYYYPENGKVAAYELYTEGKLNGDMESFYRSGNKRSWRTYKYGVKYDAQIEYFDDGSISRMEKCTGTTNYSVITRYDSSTRKPTIKGEYQKEKRTGLWYRFYPGTEVVHSKEQYKAGLNDGDLEVFYPDGTKELKGRFNNGKREGKWNYYYANSGKDWMKMEYSNDMMVGEVFVYYETGDLKRHEVYKGDTLVNYECLSQQGEKMDYKPLFVNAKFDGDDVTTFIGNELKYPELALIERKEGKVSVEFVVNEDGSISDADVTQSLSEECDKEALRIVAAMPKWKPATIDGVAFKTVRSVPVVFWLH